MAEWNVPAKFVKSAVLSVTGPAVKYQRNIWKNGYYRFKDGKHGELYFFELSYFYRGKKVTQKLRRMFLDFEKLPNLMTVKIDTEDGKDPNCERANKPQGVMGSTIIKTNYQRATFNGIPLKIRVRGNTSALGSPKKPYKIRLNKKIDILELGEDYADREWYLLNGGWDLKTYFGLHLSRILGMEWEPRMRFVNLMLNGDWKGVYILCEAITPSLKRVNISKKGYIIESDAYFWNSKGNYFKSSLFHKNVGFTFKYPKITSKFDPKVLAVQKQIYELEYNIKRNSDKMYEFIDIDTFSSWLLAHEIMGSLDAGGSNKYFYKYNADKKNKLKMGPTWDFDSLFMMGDSEHSTFYSANFTYFPYLLKNKTFREAYKKKYFGIAPSIEEKMRVILEEARNISGLEESRQLDAKIWRNYKSMDTEIEELMGHLHERIKWLNEENAKL